MKFLAIALVAFSSSAAFASDPMLKVSYSCVNDNHDRMELKNRVSGPEFDMNGVTCSVTFDHSKEDNAVHVYRPRYNFRNKCSQAIGEGSVFSSVEIPLNVIIEHRGGYPQHTSIVVNSSDRADEFQCEKN